MLDSQTLLKGFRVHLYLATGDPCRPIIQFAICV